MKYVGDISPIQIDQTRVLTISDLQFTPFADIVMRHRIFWWKKPCVKLQ